MPIKTKIAVEALTDTQVATQPSARRSTHMPTKVIDVDEAELRAAILARDALIERIRNGEEELLEEMYSACRRVEDLPSAFEVNA
jgi:hypothetical protein